MAAARGTATGGEERRARARCRRGERSQSLASSPCESSAARRSSSSRRSPRRSRRRSARGRWRRRSAVGATRPPGVPSRAADGANNNQLQMAGISK